NQLRHKFVDARLDESIEIWDNRAEILLVSLVEVDRPVQRLCAPDAYRHGVDHLPKLPLAAAQRLFGAHLIVYIVTEPVPVEDASALIADRLGAARHPAIYAVGAAQTIPQGEALASDEATAEGVP